MSNTAMENPDKEVISSTIEKSVDEKDADKKPIEEKADYEKPIEEKAIGEKAVDEKPIVEQPIEENPIEEKPIIEETIEEKLENEHPVVDQLVEEEQSEKYQIHFEEASDVSKQMRRQIRREKRNHRLEAQDRRNRASLSTIEQSKGSLSINSKQSINATMRISQQCFNEDKLGDKIKPDRSTMLLDDAYETALIEAAMEEESSSSETKISQEYCSVHFKDTFLEFFEDLPSLSEISLDEPEEDVMLSSFVQDESDEIEIKDVGDFVHPITGEILSSSSSSYVSTDGVAEALYEEQDTDDVELLSTHTSFEFVEKQEDLEFDALVNFENVIILDYELMDELESEAKIHARITSQITKEFINDLIKNVVINAELISEKVMLAKNIDKQKLYVALVEAISDLSSVKYLNQELNKKVVEYYKRRRYFRSIQPLSHAEEEKEQKRYEMRLRYYDHLLKKEDDYKKHHAMRKAELQKNIDKHQKLSLESEQQLEATIRNTFSDRQFDEYRTKIEGFLKIMRKKREDISAIRLILIQRQHTMATLLEELDNLGKINSNLLMNTFVSTQTEILALEKKIEERNNELNKLRTSCNAELINAAHLRERIDLFQKMIKNEMGKYKILSKKHREKREHLSKIKVEHVRMRKLIVDKSFQGGLLDKPLLMYDFDETVEAIEAQRTKINIMRENLQTISHKINMAEKLYASRI